MLVDPEGRVKVTDFGIARAGASQMTEVGSIVGTAQYLSPEQARGTAVDQRSDIYSVGIVLYELLTGTVPFTGDTPVEIAMKHISSTPEPPSVKRPDVPHDLDLVVMRALAKDPNDRYDSTDEMEADLDRLARGMPVSRATEESATQILAPATAATMVSTPRRPPGAAPPPVVRPPVYYDYDEPMRRRPFWPWLLALLFVVGAGVGAYFLYGQIHNQLSANKSVAVDLYVGLRQPDAVSKINAAGLKPVIDKQPNADPQYPAGFVFGQDPSAGTRVDSGSTVTLTVSTGKPKVDVPDVVGKSQTDAVAELTQAKLKVDPHQINSDQPTGQVIAQDPPAGASVIEGTKVRINISSGPKPVGVPPVVGQSFETANSELQAAGFKVARVDVDSNQPADTVVDQSPASNSFAGKGTTVTLKVSKGPTTSAVPDVTSEDATQARSDLSASGFKVRTVQQDTNDPTLDGIVTTQNPGGGTQAKPGTTVTITVGHYVAPPPATTATTTTTTP